MPEHRTGLTRRQLLAAMGATTLTLGRSIAAPPAADLASDLHYASLLNVSRLLQAKKLSPVELTQMMLDRIESKDEHLKSYVTVTADRAISAARRAESEILAGHYRGPLHGVPIGIKDLCYTKGVATMAGTKVLRNFVPRFSATVVEKLQEAGAISLGKLALCEGAQAPYHPELEIPVNPWNQSLWSGVSSSGSGVATAAGLCFGSVGTDTGGSIRYPSAVNGCVGLKPTYGRVSRYGVFPLAESMDHIGPMTRTVADAAIMYEVMAGFDPRDGTSLPDSVAPVWPQLDRNIEGMRIGFDRRYATDNVDAEVADATEDVIMTLRRLGADIVDVAMPDVGRPTETWYALGTVEAALAHQATFPQQADEYGPGFRGDLEYGLSTSAVDYARAARQREEVGGRVRTMLANIDCFVCPSMSNTARKKSENPYEIDGEEWTRLVTNDIFSKPFNFARVPTLCVPSGFSSTGVPISVQFVGRQLGESMILRTGHAYERASDWHTRHPAI
jgi:amidase